MELPKVEHVLSPNFKRALRLGSVCLRSVGSGGISATVEIDRDEALRIRLHHKRPWRAQPGQYIYLILPRISFGTSHPFSIAWAQEVYSAQGTRQSSTIDLIVRCRSGFTKKLFNETVSEPGQKLTTVALIEGPFGSEDLSSYGTVVLFAAGIGVTHHLQQILHLTKSYANHTAAVRRITLVWVIRSTGAFEWIRQWLIDIVESQDPQSGLLRIMLFVTKPDAELPQAFNGYPAHVYFGKPNLQGILERLVYEDGGAAAVSVCGPGSFADDVCKVVRSLQPVWNVDLYVQGFS